MFEIGRKQRLITYSRKKPIDPFDILLDKPHSSLNLPSPAVENVLLEEVENECFDIDDSSSDSSTSKPTQRKRKPKKKIKKKKKKKATFPQIHICAKLRKEFDEISNHTFVIESTSPSYCSDIPEIQVIDYSHIPPEIKFTNGGTASNKSNLSKSVVCLDYTSIAGGEDENMNEHQAEDFLQTVTVDASEMVQRSGIPKENSIRDILKETSIRNIPITTTGNKTDAYCSTPMNTMLELHHSLSSIKDFSVTRKQDALSCSLNKSHEFPQRGSIQKSVRQSLIENRSHVSTVSVPKKLSFASPSSGKALVNSSTYLGAKFSTICIHDDSLNKTKGLTCSHSILLVEFEHSVVHINALDPLQRVLHLCNPDSIISFSEAYDWKTLKCQKIGEGSYGEVFSIKMGNAKKTVVKIVPIKQGKLDEIFPELIISKRLSEMKDSEVNCASTFIALERACIVKGVYPNELLKAWDDYDTKKQSLNERPDLEEDDLSIILEFEFAGVALDCFKVKNGAEALSIFKQILLALAIAEEQYCFEHRDMHTGNILVSRNAPTEITYIHRGRTISIPSFGVSVKIIDFSISRMEGEYVISTDLESDTELFTQQGDYQFDVYREMKKYMKKDWRQYIPYTNILWLSYLARKLLECKYTHPKSKIHKECLEALHSIEKEILHCETATDISEKFVPA